jgi:hypothetical protein
MMSRRPPNAPTGMPPPMILPSVVRSGRTPYKRLRAAEGDAKSGHDFVEDQQRAGAIAFAAQRLEEAGRGRHAVHVAGDRLDDHAGDLLADLAERLAHLAPRRCSSASPCVGERRGTPGEVGTPRVSAPEPALISSESECP